MNYKLIFRLLGVITVALGLAFVCCLFVGFLDRSFEGKEFFEDWLTCIGITATFAIIFFSFSANASKLMFRKEGLAVIGIGWILSSFLGALPYYFIVDNMSLADAFFESASGLTTTGASVIPKPEELPHSLLFWRAMSQWIGGLGVVVFFVAILSSLGVGSKILFSNESSGQAADMDSGLIQKGVQQIMILYCVLSLACTIVFKALGMDLFDAITHMFATVSTGGFSTHSESFAYFKSPQLEWACMVFMFLGGMSFMLILRVVQHDYGILRRNTEFKVYVGVVVVLSFIVASLIRKHHGVGLEESYRSSFFQVISIMTTTGFSSTDYNLWNPAAQVFLIMLMICGACSGSTAGGLKLIRVVVGVRVVVNHIEKAFRSRVVRSIHINQKAIDTETKDTVITYIVMAAMVSITGLLILAFFHNKVSFEGSVSAILATISNIGPGFAEVGPSKNFAFMNDQAKYLLSFLMIIGRLEFYAIMALLIPSFWRKYY